MTLLDTQYFPDSQVNTLTAPFYLDGLVSLTNAEFFRSDILYASRLIAFTVQVKLARTIGTLTFVLKKNGSVISGTTLLIDGTNPTKISASSLNVTFIPTDVLTAEVTGVGFNPSSNAGNISILLK